MDAFLNRIKSAIDKNKDDSIYTKRDLREKIEEVKAKYNISDITFEKIENRINKRYELVERLDNSLELLSSTVNIANSHLLFGKDVSFCFYEDIEDDSAGDITQEPQNKKVINRIPKYKISINMVQINRGFGSLAHEWFHLMDYVIGEIKGFHDNGKYMLPEYISNTLSNEVVNYLIYEKAYPKNNSIKSGYYYNCRLKDEDCDDKNKSKLPKIENLELIDKSQQKYYYFSLKQEMFARAGHSYIAYLLDNAGIEDKLLAGIVEEDPPFYQIYTKPEDMKNGRSWDGGYPITPSFIYGTFKEVENYINYVKDKARIPDKEDKLNIINKNTDKERDFFD